jgi:hypothetical protein
VCRGAFFAALPGNCVTGPSPRVRGSPLVTPAGAPIAGTIPACAGEPFTGMPARGDHARACGGAVSTWVGVMSRPGPPPRMRGSRPAVQETDLLKAEQGPSPRVLRSRKRHRPRSPTTIPDHRAIRRSAAICLVNTEAPHAARIQKLPAVIPSGPKEYGAPPSLPPGFPSLSRQAPRRRDRQCRRNSKMRAVFGRGL